LKKIDEMVYETSWNSSEQLKESIYEDIEQRFIRNSTDKNLSIKDRKNLKYPNYLYLLSNAATYLIKKQNIILIIRPMKIDFLILLKEYI